MTSTYLGFLLFVLPHAWSSLAPAMRDRAVAWAGQGRFKSIYSLLVGIGFILMVVGYWTSRSGGSGADLLYQPFIDAKPLTLLLVPLGFVFLAASGGQSHLKLWLQNPMSVGIACWSIGHLLVVGKSAVVWFYLAMLLVAVFDIASSMFRKIRPAYVPRWRDDMKAVLIGLVVAALLVSLFHPYVLGVRV